MLHKQKYNDTSEIVSLFTETHGSLSFIVKIPKTRRAGVKAVLFQPLNQLEVEWEHYDNRSFLRIKNVRCIYLYSTLTFDPIKATIVSYIAEFLYYSIRKEQSSNILFDYLLSSLQWLDVAHEDYSNFHIALQISVARFLGIFPNVDDYAPGCIFDLQNSCYSLSLPLHDYYLKNEEAGFVCHLVKMNILNMHYFHFTTPQRSRLLSLLNTYYRLHVPGFPVMKSIEVLRQVFS